MSSSKEVTNYQMEACANKSTYINTQDKTTFPKALTLKLRYTHTKKKEPLKVNYTQHLVLLRGCWSRTWSRGTEAYRLVDIRENKDHKGYLQGGSSLTKSRQDGDC